MKKYSVAMSVIIIMGLTSGTMAQNIGNPAQPNSAKFTAYETSLVTALHSDCQGLVESALMQSAKIKMKYPSADFKKVEDEMESLSVQGSSPAIRYKAYLATAVCINPESFAGRVSIDSNETEPFFASVARAMQEQLLGYSGNQ